MSAPPEKEGIIGWMTRNHVTPNLLMIVLIIGGLFLSFRIKKEVFPDFELDRISISVPYPGAGPEEVERGIIMPIEEAVRGLDGIEEITANANEGSGSVTLELLADADQDQVFQEVEQAVGRIRTFPLDAEDPVVNRVARRRQVLSVILYGDVEEAAMRDIAEQARDRLLQHEGISQVDVSGARAAEIHVEIPHDTLREHNLTLNQVTASIRSASVDLPGGALETRSGEILLRVTDRRDWASEFAGIPILTTEAGGIIRLGDIAIVREDFEKTTREATFNGKRSISLNIFRVGDQTPITVSDATYEAMAELEADLPDGVSWDVTRDRSDYYRGRLELLLKNAFIGLCLVLVVLGLFLEVRVAFWVTMGIPTSFLGGMIFLYGAGASINIVSMFAFIVALGIVVDDAIVAGENIYEYRAQGMSAFDAAVQGARDVAMPIAVSILSNILAFLPLAFIPGTMGKIWKVIPMVVVAVFLISWVESLLILPAHLAHTAKAQGEPGLFRRFQQSFARGIVFFAERIYGPIGRFTLRFRMISVTVALGFFALSLSYVFGGHIGMILMPRVESDTAAVTVYMPFGTPPERMREVRETLVRAADQVRDEHDNLITGTLATINDNSVEVLAYLTDPEVRPLSTTEVTKVWRKNTGKIFGAESVRFQADRGGPGSGAALTIELSHRDTRTLDRAAKALAASLSELPMTKDVEDGTASGKPQFDVTLTPAGESLGLTSAEVARQIRNAFFGSQALRQQRAYNEVTVYVRRPEAERESAFDVENMLITAPNGSQVPLRDVAHLELGRSYTSITRNDARRTLRVQADVQPLGQVNQVKRELDEVMLPALAKDFPGLSFQYRGRSSHMREGLDALWKGFMLAMVGIYFLLAMGFRSYLQPLVIMIAIPFGIIGAVIGHVIMDYDLSLISMMGIVALSGVVVNDSLVLIEYANRRVKAGATPLVAMSEAGIRRFRPVLLTTLTTFGGLAPMIFETSRQARFLIPMALSLGFGILFATVITLFVVPGLYVVLEEDIKGNYRKLKTRLLHPGQEAEPVGGE